MNRLGDLCEVFACMDSINSVKQKSMVELDLVFFSVEACGALLLVF